MKIVTWNCNGALRNKLSALDTLEADVYVIQECENPARSNQAYQQWAGEYLWRGNNKNKGIGVFAKKGHALRALNWNSEFNFKIEGVKHRSLSWKSEDLELFLPCVIDADTPLLAAWTKANNAKNFGYIGQFWIYLQMHQINLTHPRQIICGDFNSNSIWDEPDRLWNHTDVIGQLENISMQSLYHAKYSEQQGKESIPTFYLHRNKNKPYHIDYMFLNSTLINNAEFTIHTDDHWLDLSDHRPLECNI